MSGMERLIITMAADMAAVIKGLPIFLSTLRQYVEAIGGKLNLTVELPNEPPVELDVLSDLVDHSQS
jgi:hypothetical protein